MKHGKKTFVIIEAVLGILVILVLGFIIYKQNGHDPETIAVIIPDVDCLLYTSPSPRDA